MPLLRWPVATLVALTFAISSLSLAPTPTRAESDLFTVERVAVDETAASAAQARERALTQGQRAAFQRLLARMVPRERLRGVTWPSDDALADLVHDFEVFDERTSSVRYLADLTFRFRPDAVRGYLRDNGIPYAEARGPSVVVLAIFGAGDRAVLWEDPNPWREAWTLRMDEPGLVPFEVPLGDLLDMEAVSAREALDADAEALRRVAARYDAEEVLVTQAMQDDSPEDEPASVRIVSIRMDGEEPGRRTVDSVTQREDEGLVELYARAAESVARVLEEDWKRQNLLRFEDRREMLVEVPLTGLADWVGIERRLAAVPLIGESRLRSLTRERAEVDLVYFGEGDQLRLVLARNGLRLDEDEEYDGGWVLRPAGGVSEPAIRGGETARPEGRVQEEPTEQ